MVAPELSPVIIQKSGRMRSADVDRNRDVSSGVPGHNNKNFPPRRTTNKVEPQTGFLHEAAEIAESARTKPRFFLLFPLFASVQSFNPLASVFFAFSTVKASAFSGSLRANSCNSCKAPAFSGFLQEATDIAESARTKPRFFPLFPSFALSPLSLLAPVQHVRDSALSISFSLTPCFSWVQQWPQPHQPFQRFPHAVETVETVPISSGSAHTQLKQGVNEKSARKGSIPPSIPKGLRHKAQGCDEVATLGKADAFLDSTPTGLRRGFGGPRTGTRARGRNPVGVEMSGVNPSSSWNSSNPRLLPTLNTNN